MHPTPQDTAAQAKYDPDAPLRFLINAASGRNAADAKRAAIEAELNAGGRRGELLFVAARDLAERAARAAEAAAADGGAVVAVGGDGTINAVAHAAHTRGCVLGVVAQGTFNYFARTHGLPTEAAEAVRGLLQWQPQAVQVAKVNDRVFLVNASLGLYPALLEDREAYKARYGRSRLVALGAAVATALGAHRRLHLQVELDGRSRAVRAQTLFVGNNRLQLDQVGLSQACVIESGRVAAVILPPIGTLALLGLLLRGAMGTLGDAETVESFDFQRMVVRPSRLRHRRSVKVALDGEIAWLRPPLNFHVPSVPLRLLKPAAA